MSPFARFAVRPALAAPLVAAAALRLGLLGLILARSGTAALYRPDTASYLLPGRNLLLHGSFSASSGPEVGRTPGYALFLALTHLGGPLTTALVQIALALTAVALAARLVLNLTADRRRAQCAAWLAALDPLSALYSLLLLSESLFCLLLLVSLERLTAFLRTRRAGPLLVSGLALGAAMLVRPVALCLPWCWAFGLFFSCLAEPRWRWRAPALLLAAALPFSALWQLRNGLETGFYGLTSVPTENLYFYNAADLAARRAGHSLAEEQQQRGYGDPRLFLALHPETSGWRAGDRLGWMSRTAQNELRTQPALVLGLHLAGSLRTAFNPGAATLLEALSLSSDRALYERERTLGPGATIGSALARRPLETALSTLLLLFPLLVYALALSALTRRRLPAPAAALLLGTALYFFAVSGGPVATSRFRLPAMVPLAALAATGWPLRQKNATASLSAPTAVA